MTASARYTDSFGFLPRWIAVEFSRGAIRPLEHFLRRKSAVAKRTNSDGYVYPPYQHTLQASMADGKVRRVPRSRRPALLYRLVPSHSLELHGVSSDRDEVRRSEAGFVMHFLSLIYGGRYQFFDWWFDGRVQVGEDFEFASPELERVASCIDGALQTYASWSPDRQMIATNAMYLFGRTAVHERESDRFQAEYQVADAAWFLAWSSGKIPGGPNGRKPPHAERLDQLCRVYGLASDPTQVKELVDLRNPLLHEALWDGGMPGTPRSDTSFHASYWLHRLSQRALLAVLGLRGEYLRSPWWQMGGWPFDVEG